MKWESKEIRIHTKSDKSDGRSPTAAHENKITTNARKKRRNMKKHQEHIQHYELSKNEARNEKREVQKSKINSNNNNNTKDREKKSTHIAKSHPFASNHSRAFKMFSNAWDGHMSLYICSKWYIQNGKMTMCCCCCCCWCGVGGDGVLLFWYRFYLHRHSRLCFCLQLLFPSSSLQL